MIATAGEVDLFLKDIKQKIKTNYTVIYVHRKKNTQALIDLGITAMERKDWLNSLEVKDYFRGPSKDPGSPETGDAWEFGKDINGQEVYIKIKLGKFNKPVICISFHFSE